MNRSHHWPLVIQWRRTFIRELKQPNQTWKEWYFLPSPITLLSLLINGDTSTTFLQHLIQLEPQFNKNMAGENQPLTSSSRTTTKKTVCDKTFQGIGNLIKVHLSGTVFLFQFLNSLLNNKGSCHSVKQVFNWCPPDHMWLLLLLCFLHRQLHWKQWEGLPWSGNEGFPYPLATVNHMLHWKVYRQKSCQ